MCWCVDQTNGEMLVDDQEVSWVVAFITEPKSFFLWNYAWINIWIFQDQKFAGFELTCEADDESHNQDGLNIWDFNLHDLISDWTGMGDKKDSTEEMMANWMQSSNLANLNFAPQNTNVQNFINIRFRWRIISIDYYSFSVLIFNIICIKRVNKVIFFY